MTATQEMLAAEKSAVGLYAVLAYDFLEFLEMMREELNNDALVFLYKMLVHQTDQANEEINKLGVYPVLHELQKRGVDPRSTLYTHIMEEDG